MRRLPLPERTMITNELRIDTVALVDAQRANDLPAKLSSHEMFVNIDASQIECRMMIWAKTKHVLGNIRTVMRSAEAKSQPCRHFSRRPRGSREGLSARGNPTDSVGRTSRRKGIACRLQLSRPRVGKAKMVAFSIGGRRHSRSHQRDIWKPGNCRTGNSRSDLLHWDHSI